MPVSKKFPRRWFYSKENTRIAMLVKDPLCSTVLTAMAPDSIVDSLGRCGVNQGGTFTNVGDQRHTLQATYRGISQNRSTSIAKGVLACDYAFNTGWNVDGSFDGASTTAFSVLGFLDAYFQVWAAMIQDGRDVSGFSTHSTKAETSLGWLINDSPALFPAEWAALPITTNGVSGLAMTLLLASILLRQPTYRTLAETYITQIGAQQNADGWFNENGGFDSHYMNVNLWRHAVMMNYLDQSHKLDRIMKSGLNWWKTKFITTPGATLGKIDSTGNSRVDPLQQGHYVECLITMILIARVARDRFVRDQAEKTYRYALSL